MDFRRWTHGKMVCFRGPSSVHDLLTRPTEFGHPNGSTLGLFSAILQIGAFSAIFFCKAPRISALSAR